ncbi:MAG: 50S ribosomal protein L34e [Candidatus Woesearchaeota archaeon]
MPLVKNRSRSLRKVYVKTPGGRTTVHYRKRKPKIAKCSKCSKALQGVPRERPYKMKSMAKTEKRPERPYGGVLCNKCMRAYFKEKSRSA